MCCIHAYSCLSTAWSEDLTRHRLCSDHQACCGVLCTFCAANNEPAVVFWPVYWLECWQDLLHIHTMAMCLVPHTGVWLHVPWAGTDT
jgi:hypothetical protein